jgi:hypothetical protein
MTDAFSILRNFTPEELACPLTGGYVFHPTFPEKLQALRDIYGKPIYPTSCCRSEEYNATLPGSSKQSLHIYDHPKRGALGTCAIDVRVTDSIDRHELIKVALALGFSAYFITPDAKYIHLDLRIDLGEPARFWAQ